MKDVAFSKQLFSLNDIQNIDTPSILLNFFKAAINNSLPVALWRTPDDKQKYGIVNFSENIQASKIDFTNNQAGFAFSPFRNDTGNCTLFIKSHLFLNSKDKTFAETAEPNYSDSENIKRAGFIKSFNKLIETGKNNQVKWFTGNSDKPAIVYSKNDFCKLIEHSVEHIKSSDVRKIVASRTLEIELAADFDPVRLFNDLTDQYPDAFVSLVSIPGTGTWIGATPETLVSLKENHLTTMALAGTKARTVDVPLPGIEWNHKEIEEQELVAEYIRNCFKKLDCENFEERAPMTIKAGNVVHLQSLFKIKMDEKKLKDFANRFLYLLHPTPAVCGLPKDEALSFILEHEIHNREFYSGFLGPVNINSRSTLFVNLRCMQLREKTAVLYAGCGITSDSDPEKEWKETELKANTLLSVINK